MTVAQQTPAPPKLTTSEPPRRNPRWSGFLHILSVRMKELRREPEVVFWVFGFPILLALGLGIAFRNKPADAIPVVIVSGPGAQDAVSMIQRSLHPSAIRVDVLDEPAALGGFRLAKYDLVIQSHGQGGYEYRYD